MGNRLANLQDASRILAQTFTLVAESRIYESAAVDYLQQPDFYNQVLEFTNPNMTPEEVMQRLLQIEKQLGRNRDIPKGPRAIDLDLLFWDSLKMETPVLTLPHPRLFERSFVVLPLSELPGFPELQKHFSFPEHFDNSAKPIPLS